ncbi:MAG: glycoside hydrolase family 5 protein [Phototrophicaceae bacterium]|jgi:endoglucanase
MMGLFRVLLVAVTVMLFTVTYAQEIPNAGVGRCINLGNMLEAPTEGEWGLRVQPDYLPMIANAGFDTVRVPIRWSAHAETRPPYTIDAGFFARVDEVVAWALAEDLQVILNIHHYEEIMAQPAQHVDRLNGLWDQIGRHYASAPDGVMFEILNEPNSGLSPIAWNAVYPDVLATIRQSNPTRRVIVGGGEWNSLNGLAQLELPEDTDHLIATFHYYLPFEFTHQGAEWVNGTNAWLGTIWGSAADHTALESDFAEAMAWQSSYGVPVLLGEFGAYSKADLDSRLAYTGAVRAMAEANGMGWCYWEFASGFGIYNPATLRFNSLYRALIPED